MNPTEATFELTLGTIGLTLIVLGVAMDKTSWVIGGCFLTWMAKYKP